MDESIIISFVLKVFYGVVTGAILMLINWIRRVAVKADEDRDRITGLEKDLALNSQKDQHIDEALKDITAKIEALGKKLDDFILRK